MRETLTALAILLILLLTAALAAPYFVDWNSQRAFVEARLSHALGQKVTVGGSIDLKLLPTPYLILDQAVIGGDDGPITMGIRHLDLELSVTPLLHGEFDVVEARLEEPTIRVTLQHDRTLPPLPDAPAFKADVRFDRIAVIDGTLAIADPQSGRTFALEHLDFEAEAESLAGPFKGNGAAGASDSRTKFRFAASAADHGRARTKLVVEETSAHAGVDLDGTVTLTDVSGGSIRQSFDGAAILSGRLSGREDLPLPWRLSGAVHADPAQAKLDSGELRIGGEEHSLVLAATGDADLGDTPALQLNLVGKQIDVDRLFAPSAATDGDAAKPRLPDLAGLRRALVPPLPTTVNLSVATATYAGQTLSNLDGSFALATDQASALRFAGDGPGRVHLAVDGKAAPATGRAFEGKVALSAGDLPATLAWLSTVVPGFTRPDLPVRAVDARGNVTVGDDGIDVAALALRLDRSTMTGAVHFAAAKGSEPAALKADLRADALDLDALPDLSALRTQSAATDLDLKLDARGLKVARVGDSALDAGRLRVALTKTGGHFALGTFRIEGLGGATIDATATLDPRGGRLDATLDADRLGDAAALFHRVAPSAWSDALVARAAALTPAKLTISAALKPIDAPSGPLPRAMTVVGLLGATKLDATLYPDPSNDKTIIATGSASAPEGSVLLRQLGIPALPLNTLGASRIALDAKGPLDGALTTTVHAAFGATTLDLAGQLSLASAPSGSGTAKLASRDISTLLQSTAVAFPDLTGRIPVDLGAGVAWTPAGLSFADLKGQIDGVATSGSLMWHSAAKAEPALTGALAFDRLSLATLLGLSLGPAQQPAAGALWSATAFGSGLIDPPKSAVDLTAKAFDFGQGLSGSDAAVTVSVSQGLVALKGLTAGLNGGRVGGDLTLRRDGVAAAVEGKLALTDVALDLPSATGRFSGHADVAGSGRSPLALIASLAGTGDATIADLRVPRADPAALSKIFDDVEGDRLSVDEDSIVRALDDAAAAALDAGSRPFTLSLASGILHLDPKPDAASKGPVSSTVSASVDLRKPAIDERVAQTLQALPKSWTGAPPQIVILYAGPLKSPARTTDISVFINALATRALARESARIEAYEFDVHERAFFNARLQSDRRREQERLQAEEQARQAVEAARKAEAERRAREAAAKVEKARKAEEAARAVEEQRAAQEEAAHNRAIAEQQARDRAAQRRQDQEQRAAPAPSSLDQPAYQSPGNPTDPSAAGRY
ncbi:AsmA family protein [Beijerinckia sp. L45]|uniref:AsmA family protein n=1 Tax=Beijerinckia sp. L45 TaxID=1641855 RepID=UPI00131E1ED4|nr:AsmA family protein [Beijerinckia sp. L45]